MDTTTAPMTERQARLIHDLMAERTLADDLLERLQRTLRGDVPAEQASRIIAWMLKQPKTYGADVEVPAGRYAVNVDGALRFYRVDRPTEGKWAGRTFLSVQASDEFHPIRQRQTRTAILKLIAADPQEATIRYGRELGVCGVCGRTLTDEASRAAGIGPVCAAERGIGRLPKSAPAAPPAPAEALAPAAPREPSTALRTRRASRSSDGRDGKGVHYGYGDWRQRQAQVDATLAEDGRGPKGEPLGPCSQLSELPGTTFEDIFPTT